MASRPSDQGPVAGRVDRAGLLISADAALLRLQQEAGSGLGAPLALPQVAAVVRSAISLGVPLSRAVIAAGADRDYDLWVRAQPDAEGADLVIEGWTARPPAPPRLTLVISEPEVEQAEPARPVHGFAVDAELKLTAMDASLAARLGIEASEVAGQPLTRFFILIDDGDGLMPLLMALGNRQDFEGQRASLRGSDGANAVLSGVARRDGGRFDGFDGNVEIEGEGDSGQPRDRSLSVDPALDSALRSPLDRIIAAADRIVERTEGPLRSDYATYAGDIAAAGRHLLSVIKAMSEGQRGGQTENISMETLVAEAVQLVQTRAAERQLFIEAIPADGSVTVRGDPRQIVQILVNILGNAVRHSPEGGTIAILFTGDVSTVGVTIADQGPGIAPADQARIFERYERAEGSVDGIGLGLAISRRLARAMGGDVTLASTPGQGSRFTLTLPAA